MTALFAVIGDAEEAGFSLTSGRATVDPKSGKNSFEAFEGGAHSYLVKEKENDFYKTMIDDILMSE